MRRLSFPVLALCAAVVFPGCFTVHHSPYPEVQMSSLPEGRKMSVQLTGFEASLTTYIPVYGYETSYRSVSSCHHHHNGHHCHSDFYMPETYTTTTYLPQTSPTTAFVERAQASLEDAGFSLQSTTGAVYRVEVKFDGPHVSDTDRTVKALWMVLSALSADYSARTWTARLKIYDVASGDLVMHADYEQKCSAAVWGPVPILSPAASEQTDFNTQKCWSLTALTDRAMADATAFLTAQMK